MTVPPYFLLWLLGIFLVVVSWYVPNAGGFFWLGGLTLGFGVLLALVRKG